RVGTSGLLAFMPHPPNGNDRFPVLSGKFMDGDEREHNPKRQCDQPPTLIVPRSNRARQGPRSGVFSVARPNKQRLQCEGYWHCKRRHRPKHALRQPSVTTTAMEAGVSI